VSHAILSNGGIHLSLPAFAWFFVVSVFAQVGKDSGLLAVFLEAPQGAFEIIVGVENDFRHAGLQVNAWGEREM
jgi:hypothetical protein